MHSAAGTVTRFRESAAMIKLLPGLPDNVVGVVASGELTGRDYEQVKMAVNSAVQTVGRVRLLIQMAPGFTGHTADASWSEARMGVTRLTDWEKIAVVTDEGWIRGTVVLFRLFASCPVKIFGNDALAEATAWIVE